MATRGPSLAQVLKLLEKHPSVFELEVGDIKIRRALVAPPGGAVSLGLGTPASAAAGSAPAAPAPAADIELALNQPVNE